MSNKEKVDILSLGKQSAGASVLKNTSSPSVRKSASAAQKGNTTGVTASKSGIVLPRAKESAKEGGSAEGAATPFVTPVAKASKLTIDRRGTPSRTTSELSTANLNQKLSGIENDKLRNQVRDAYLKGSAVETGAAQSGQIGKTLGYGTGLGINEVGKQLTGAVNMFIAKPLTAAGEQLEKVTGEDSLLSPFASSLKNNIFHEPYNLYQKTTEDYREKVEEAAGGSKGLEAAGEAASGVTQALPTAILALLTGGGSAAAQMTTEGLEAASALNTATGAGKVLTAAVQTAGKLAKNPNYWASFLQTVNGSYENNREKGASEAEAYTAATLSSLVNGLVEMGGGIQTLPDIMNTQAEKSLLERLVGKVTKKDIDSAVLQWVSSSLEEGGEEAVQSVLENLTNKAVYQPDMKWASARQGEDAVANLPEMAQGAGMGTLVGGILGGGQMAVHYAVNGGRNPQQTAVQSRQEADNQQVSRQQDMVQMPLQVAAEAQTAQRQRAEAALTLPLEVGKTAQGETVNTAPIQEGASSAAVTETGATEGKFAQAAELAQALGVKLQVRDDLGAGLNGYYENGTIAISRDAGNPVMQVFTHELTHHIEQSGQYEAFSNFVLRHLEQAEGADISALTAEIAQEYEGQGISLGVEQARRELVAKFAEERMFTDQESIRRLAQTDRNLFQRIYDWIRDTIAKVRGTSEERFLMEAQRRYKQALETVELKEDAQTGRQYSLVGETADGVEVYETGEEVRQMPRKQRVETFMNIMRNEYAGRTAKFTANGEVYYAKFDEADLRKNVYGDKKSSTRGWRAKINTGADGDIFELVENAQHHHGKYETGKNTSAHKGVTGWEYFVKTVQIDGRVYDLLANVRKKPEGEYVYSIQLNESKKTSGAPVAVFANRNPALQLGAPDAQSVSDSGQDVNRQSGAARRNSMGSSLSELMARSQNKGREAMLTGEDRTALGGREQVEHRVVSEQESFAQAGESLSGDLARGEAEGSRYKYMWQTLREMEGMTAWDQAQVDYSKMALRELLEEARGSGDWSEYLHWNGVDTAKGTRAAQELNARKKWAKRESTQGFIQQQVAEKLEEMKKMGKGLSPQETNRLMSETAEQAQALEEATQLEDGQQAQNRMIGIILDVAEKRGINRRVLTGTGKKNTLSRFANRILHQLSTEELTAKAAASIVSQAADANQASAGARIKTLQVLNQLMNFRTTGKNLAGNSTFDFLDCLASRPAALLDIFASAATGTRSTAATRSVFSKAKWSGGWWAFQNAYVDIFLDIDTGVTEETKTGQRVGRTNKMNGQRTGVKRVLNPVERGFSTAEKYLSYALTATDEFAKGGTRAENARAMGKLAEKGRIDPWKVAYTGVKDETGTVQDFIDRTGDYLALTRTFQDNNVLSKVTQTAHDLGNTVLGVGDSGRRFQVGGGEGRVIHDFGAGDLIMPYAKVPANLAVRTVEYSPANLVRGARELLHVMRTGRGDAATVETNRGQVSVGEAQRQAVTDLSRGITGTAAIALAGWLFAKGLIVYGDREDGDEQALNTSSGLGTGASLNLSAINRVVRGGEASLQDGDTLVSVESLEPLNAILAMGAAAAQAYQEEGNGVDITKATMTAAVEAIGETPMLSAIAEFEQELKYGNDIFGAGAAMLGSSVASSLTPSLLRQTAQATDGKYRDVYSGQFGGVAAYNALNEKYGLENEKVQALAETADRLGLSDQVSKVMQGVPGLRQKLPEKLTPLGEAKEYTGNKALDGANALLLPLSIGKMRDSDVTQELRRLTQAIQEAGLEVSGVYPSRNAPSSLSHGGKKVELTYDQRQEYQQVYGQTFNQTLRQAIKSSYYKGGSVTAQAAVLQAVEEYATLTAKSKFLDDLGSSQSTLDKMNQVLDGGMSLSVYTKYDRLSGSEMKQGSAEEFRLLDTVLNQYGSDRGKAETLVRVFDGYAPDTLNGEELDEEEAGAIQAAYPQYLLSRYEKLRELEEFQAGDEEAKKDLYQVALSYAREKAKEKGVTGYEPTKIVSKVDTLEGAGMTMGDYATWSGAKEALSGSGQKYQYLELLYQDSGLSVEEKQLLYTVTGGYSDANEIDWTDGNTALSSAMGETLVKRVNRFTNLTGGGYLEYYEIYDAEKEYRSANGLKIPSSAKKAEKEQIHKYALAAILEDFGYPNDAGTVNQFYRVFWG